MNLTPLIDVVFLLLIFFMVSTTFQKEADLQIQLPEASADPQVQELERIELIINAQGQYFVDGQELLNNSVDTLRSAMQRVSRDRKDLPLIIRADSRTQHQSVVTAMDVAAQLGLVKMSIVTANDGS